MTSKNATTRKAGEYVAYGDQALSLARRMQQKGDTEFRDDYIKSCREYAELALEKAREADTKRSREYGSGALQILDALEELEERIAKGNAARNGTSLPPVAPVDLAPPAESEKTTDRPRRVTTELVLSWDGETEPLTLGELRELVDSLKDHPDDHVLYAESSGTAYIIRTTR